MNNTLQTAGAAMESADALKELIARQAVEIETLREKVALAYGYLWHVNNEPMAPIPLRSPEKAAYEARKILRETLSQKERGEAINKVQAAIQKELTP